MANLKKNISYNFIYQLLILLLPLATAPYLSRVIGAEGIGIYSLSYSVAIYFSYFTVLGLNNYGNRMIASVQDNLEKRSRIFWEIYCMQMFAFLICISFYLVYSLVFSTYTTVALLQIILVLSALFDINWFFFGLEKFKLTVIRNTIVKTITVLLVFLFVKDSGDIYLYIIIMASGTLISQLALWPFIRQYIKFVKIHPTAILKHLKPNLLLFIPVLSVSIYKLMDKVMLGYISNPIELGYFESSERIINVPISLITAVGTVMLPRMSSLISNNKIKESKQYIDNTLYMSLIFGIGAAMGIIVISPDFSVFFYGDDFSRTGIIMQYMAITIIIFACGNVIRTQYIIPKRLDNIYIISAILGAILNFVLNLFLIPRNGAMGAVISTIAAEFVVTFYQLYRVRKEFNYFKYIKHGLMYLVSGLIMLYLIKKISIPRSDLLEILTQVISGLSIYGILIYFYLVYIQKISILKGISLKR